MNRINKRLGILGLSNLRAFLFLLMLCGGQVLQAEETLGVWQFHAPARTYAFGSLFQASPELFVSQLLSLSLIEKDLVAGRLKLSEKGQNSKIVLLGGQFANNQWLDYLRIIDQLDPNYGKNNATILALLSSRDVEAVADSVYSIDRSSRYDVGHLVDAMALAQRVVRVGQQIFASETISGLADEGDNTIVESNQQVVTIADSLRKQLAARSSLPLPDLRAAFAKEQAQAVDEALVATILRTTGATAIISAAPSTYGLDLKSLHSMVGARGQLVVYESSLAMEESKVRHVSPAQGVMPGVPALDLGGFATRTSPKPAISRRQIVCTAAFMGSAFVAAGAYAQLAAPAPAPFDMPLEEACKATGGILSPGMAINCFCSKKNPPYYDPYLDICG